MYRIADYSWMMEDEVRISAYMAALRKIIKPGDVVVDLGAGVGTWAFVCCQLGASKVYAIEPSPAIHVAQRVAAANGFTNKVELIQEFSTAIELPEKADVIISSLHGQQPVYAASLASIIDARERFLKEGGTMIPARETMWAAVVEDGATYSTHLDFWQRPFHGLDLRAGKDFVTDWMYKERFSTEQVVTDHACYAVLDYATLDNPEVTAEMCLTVHRGSTGHGLHLWFDSEVAPQVRFSNAPGSPKTIFGGTFIPWPEPVALEKGDQVRISLGFRLMQGDYMWHCATRIVSGTETKAEYRQSSIKHNLPKLNTLAPAR